MGNPQPAKRAIKINWRFIGLILAFGFVLYFTNLGGWDLWPSDEPRFGQIEREMLRSGNWLVPHVNNEVYTDKPPLFFWAGGIVALLNGGHVESWTTRFPSALAGIVALLFTYFIGANLFSQRAALLGALAAGISTQFVDQSRTAQTDMIMTAFCTGAFWAFAAGWFGRLRPMAGGILFGVLSGLAVLGKGPVGVIVPVGSILLFILLAKEWRRGRLWAILSAVLFFAAVVLAWLLPMLSAVSHGASKDLLWDQNITRYLAATGHLNPPWFFIQQLPISFLPMTLFLPFVAVSLWREWRSEQGLSRQRLFLFCWFVFTLVFFSLSRGKRDQYILPLFPALGLMVGDWLDRKSLSGSGSAHSAYIWALRAIGSLYLLLAGLVVTVAPRILVSLEERIEGGGIPPDWFSFPVIGACVALAGACFWAGSIGRRWIRSFGGIVIGTMAFWLAVFLFIYPPLNNRRSARPLCEVLNREWEPGQTVYSYEFYRSEYQLYGDYFFTVVDGARKNELEQKMLEDFRGPRRVYCLLRAGKDYRAFRKNLGDYPCHIIWNQPIGHREILVVSNQAPRIAIGRGVQGKDMGEKAIPVE